LNKLKFYIALSMVSSLCLNATSLRNSVEDTLNSNPSIIAEHLNRDAYMMYIHQEEADYLPTIDLDAYFEQSRTNNRPDDANESWQTKDGWNSILKIEHILYDGGLTPSQALEYKHKYNSNKYRSLYEVESIILDTVEAYIDLVSRQEMLSLSKYNLVVHENYLEMAKEKEQISGEKLEIYQVNSKYHSVLDSFYEQENEQSQAINLYEKLVGKELVGDICRPEINESFLPNSLEEAIKEGLRRSYKIKEQIAKTEEQREKIIQERAGYKPTLRLQLQAELDNDLELEENGRQDIYSARLYLSWNLFQGGKTYYMTEKERIFLKEEQKKLDAVTKEVIAEIKDGYHTFYNFQKRIKNMELYEEDNFNILKIYKRQLADGTRTFIDILNAEAELYRSSIEKIQQKFDYIGSYYNFLLSMNMLSDVILMQEKQTCSRYTFTPRESEPVVTDATENLSDELLNMFADTSESVETTLESSSTESIENLFEESQEETILNLEQKDEDENRLENLYNDVETIEEF